MEKSICAQCAEVFLTCCRLTPGQENCCFPISESERSAIVSVYACNPDEVFAAEPNTLEFRDFLKHMFPGRESAIDAAFPPDTLHYRLGTDPDGKCRLLSGNGCVLPESARPLYCRLYPFWPLEGGINVFHSDSCLALRKARGVNALFGLFAVSAESLTALKLKLEKAWGIAKGCNP